MRPGQVTGFTLIEVLVTLVVLSIGLLGLAGLQIAALRANNSAFLRSQATLLANDIIDRMRTNRRNASSYDTAATAAGSIVTPDCVNAPCSGVELARYEQNKWQDAVGRSLPAGTAAVDCSTKAPVCTVTISWDDDRNGTPTQRFVTATEL